jgi:tetratricopeptide (TPR) repeat protein
MSRRGWLGAVVVLIAGGAAATYFYLHRAPVLTERDSILLTDFVNTTGDSVFDGTLKKALAVSLAQSPYLNVVSDERVQQTLKLMGRPPDTRITRDIGREICQRNGLKAVVNGSIASLGARYIVTLEVTNAGMGELLAEEQVQATGKEEVLDALGKAASRLRSRLGESLSSVQRFDKPLAEASTSSLEALKAFSLGEAQRARGGELSSIPFYKRAIELDPNFALAYARLGAVYSNIYESELAEQYHGRAFELRDRAGEREKLYIMGHYYRSKGQIDKRIQTLEVYRQTFPADSAPLSNLASTYSRLGRFEEVLKYSLEGIRLGPDAGPFAYSNAAEAYMGLNRMDEAKTILNTALERKVGGPSAHFLLSLIALAQSEADPGVALRKPLQHGGQHVACLRVRGRDRKCPGVVAAKLGADALEVLDLLQGPPGGCDQCLPRRRESGETLALAHEDARAELVLEQAHLLADPRLRSEQRRGGVGHVEVVIDDRTEVAQLLQVHVGTARRLEAAGGWGARGCEAVSSAAARPVGPARRGISARAWGRIDADYIGRQVPG